MENPEFVHKSTRIKIIACYGVMVSMMVIAALMMMAAITGIENGKIQERQHEVEMAAIFRDDETRKIIKEKEIRDRNSILPFPIRQFIGKATLGFFYEEDINNHFFYQKMKESRIVEGYGCYENYKEIP